MREWHDCYHFKDRTVPATYGIPVRLSVKNVTLKVAKNPLDRICSPATILPEDFLVYTKPHNITPKPLEDAMKVDSGKRSRDPTTG